MDVGRNLTQFLGVVREIVHALIGDQVRFTFVPLIHVSVIGECVDTNRSPITDDTLGTAIIVSVQ